MVRGIELFRLYTILARDPLPAVPDSIQRDVDRFIRDTAAVEIDFRSMGLGPLSMDEALADLRTVYL